MPAIGYVTKQSTGGYKGQLKTLSIRADIDIVPNTTNRTTSATSSPNELRARAGIISRKSRWRQIEVVAV